jgi:predicted DsbA family dithiol-disulfide isomerase
MDAIRTLPLELYADLVCPWCWIGDRRLFTALEAVRNEHPEVAFEVSWRPFQLDPSLPVEGRDFGAFVDEKFGGRVRAEPMFARVAEAGASDGLHFDFARITRLPNTVRAHGLVVHVQQTGGDPWPLVEALFAAHFEHGRDTGDVETLVEIATETGVDAATARAVITTGRYDVDVLQSQREAARLGIQGVPFLVLDGRYGVSGAQPMEVFRDALRRLIALR